MENNRTSNIEYGNSVTSIGFTFGMTVLTIISIGVMIVSQVF